MTTANDRTPATLPAPLALVLDEVLARHPDAVQHRDAIALAATLGFGACLFDTVPAEARAAALARLDNPAPAK